MANHNVCAGVAVVVAVVVVVAAVLLGISFQRLETTEGRYRAPVQMEQKGSSNKILDAWH